MGQNQRLNGNGKNSSMCRATRGRYFICLVFILFVFCGIIMLINGEENMKKFALITAFCMICMPVLAATDDANQSRRSMASQMVMSAPRVTASTNQITAMANANNAKLATTPVITPDAVRVDEYSQTDDDSSVNDREKEKQACISNNIGIGNTFVWASRYSNPDNYSSMIEDTENPDNNVCFVRVEIKSNDPKISVDDISGKYFIMGNDITCGQWADTDTLRQRILNAKKSTRTWATVGGVVGGAGLGVGAMELFGNRLIGGAVEGQRSLSDDDLLLSQLLVLRDSNKTEYNAIVALLNTIKTECDSDIYKSATQPSECSAFNWDAILNGLGQIN